MRFVLRSLRVMLGIASAGLVFATAGCGGSMGLSAQVPITVSLVISTVVVPQDGTTVIVPITITSSSETALVSVTGLPGDVLVKYAASDTNPSGTLAFTATATSQAGTYMPIVTVMSAGQTASTSFTLIVGTASKMG